MSHAKAARMKNKFAANAAELNGDQNTAEIPENAAISPSIEAAASQFAGKSPSDILLPSMSDIEKLQKLKEWILSDQHPVFTSAPKVAYLLSLRVPNASRSVADSNGSSNSLGGDQERQGGAIPLAERLSSPKMQPYTGDDQPFTDGYKTEGHHEQSDHQSASFQDSQHVSGTHESVRGPTESDSLNDVEMADVRTQGSTGPVLTPTHAAYYPRHYSRPSDDQRRHETGDDGRRSPRNDTRQWPDRRGPANGNYSRHPNGDGGRYPAGNYRGGYHNHGDRRYSGSDYQQQSTHRQYEYDRNLDRRPDHQSDDRYNGRQQGYGSRGGYQQSFGPRQVYERKGDYNRPSVREPPLPLKTDELDKASEENTSPMDVQSTVENKTIPDDQSQPEKAGDSVTATSPPSPTSANGGPPQSVAETVNLPVGSPQRSEAPLESGPGAPVQDGKATRNASPSSPLEGDAGRDVKYREQDRDYRLNNGNFAGRNPEYRRQTYDARPKVDGYQRYPPHERNYERPPPPRDDRTYATRDPSYRPSYPPPPADDRRFIPRDAAYTDDSYYRGRDYRPSGDWDAKRRDNERVPDTRLYERDRDLRPLPPAAPGPPRHVGARSYTSPADRDIVPPRQAPSRMPAEPYPPPTGPGRYDLEPYAPPPHAAPIPASYSRIRTRSMSPARRDYQPEDRPPPKRVRGPDEPYVSSAPRPAPYNGQYPPPQRRPQDYPDRRPPGGSQAAYYRPDDRGPPRY